MATHNVWCLLIDENARRIGTPFQVIVDTRISELKKAVKEEKVTDLSNVAADELIVWYCEEPRLVSYAPDEGIDYVLDNIDFTKESDVIQLASEQTLMDFQWLDDDVFLISMPGLLLYAEPRSMYLWYRAAQAKPPQTIYDGLVPSEPLYPTSSPPVHIYDPIFDEFASLVRDSKNQPTEEDQRNTWKLMRALSTPYEDDNEYQLAVVPILKDIFKFPISLVEGFGSGIQAHGMIVEENRILMILMFIAAGGFDPSIQASMSMKYHWSAHSRSSLRNKYCCPTFMLSATGPWVCVTGGVFTDRVIVQRLTDMMWTGASSPGDDQQAIENAKILVALRTCLERLKVRPPKNYELSSKNCHRPHPRFFPYPTRYTTRSGSEVVFEYIIPLEPEPTTCVTFRARVVSGPESGSLVVKFVSRYGEDVHRYLANKGRAPRLRYFGPLSGRRDTNGTVKRPGAMQMVVMDYIVGNTKPPSDARAQIEEILVDLHSEGYVVGDLREQNIMFDRNYRALLIDLDWCGRYDLKIQHKELPEKVLKAIKRKRELTSENDVDGEYVRYPVTISRSYDTWVNGMRGYEFILPEHDWGMCKRLYYDWDM